MACLADLFRSKTKDSAPPREIDDTGRVARQPATVRSSPTRGVLAGAKKVVLVGTQHSSVETSNRKKEGSKKKKRLSRAKKLYKSLSRDPGGPPRPSSRMDARDTPLKSTIVSCREPTEDDHAQDRYPVCLIVEYGPFEGRPGSKYDEECLNHMGDFRQNSYIEAAYRMENVRIIGADGRKLYLGTDRMALSIKHLRFDTGQYSFDKGVDLSPEKIKDGLRTYMALALGLHDLHSGVPLGFLATMVEYGEPLAGHIQTRAGDVLANTFELVQTQSGDLNRDWKEAIFEHVLARYEKDCPEEQPGTEEEEYRKRVQEYKDEGFADIESNQVMLDQIRQLVQSELEAKRNDPTPWVDACFDAVCNLLLFTRVLAEHKREQHVVVAFGNEHIKPLYALLTSLRVTTEPGPMTLEY